MSATTVLYLAVGGLESLDFLIWKLVKDKIMVDTLHLPSFSVGAKRLFTELFVLNG